MRNLKKAVALLLCLAMVMGLMGTMFSTAGAAPYYTQTSTSTSSGVAPQDPRNYHDIQSHWAKEALYNALQNGIMQGTSATMVEPDRNITRAEMATLMARAFEATRTANIGTFIDVKSGAWYYDYISRAVQMNLLNGNGNAMSPGGYITRQEAAVVFCRAYNLYGYTANLKTYSDYNTIASYAVDAMAACVGANVMQGTGGRLNPTAPLTRAEYTQMMYRLVQHYVNSGVAFNGGNSISGSMMITVPNIQLTNTSIGGNLYLGDGVDTGVTTLSGVNVNGTVYIRGGSELRLINGSRVRQVVVYSPSYAVKVDVDSTSSVTTTVVDTAIDTVTLTGNVGNVNLNTARVKLALVSATVGTLTANVVLPTINVDENSTVGTLTASTVADGGNITIDGKVSNFTFQAKDMDVKITGKADVGTVTMGSSGSKVTIDGDVDSFTAANGSDKNKVTINNGATVDRVILDSTGANDFDIKGTDSVKEFETGSSSTNQSLSLQAYKYTISSGASGATVKFVQGTAIQELAIMASNANVTVDTGAAIENITITGANSKVTGMGTVKTVTVNPGGAGSSISTPNTKVINNSGGDVWVGGEILPSGYEMTTDATGKGSKLPGLEDLQSKPSGITAAYPKDASPSDFNAAGDNYTLGTFGKNMGYNSSVNSISGTFNYFENFPLWAGTNYNSGYYMPLVLTLANRTPDFVVEILGKQFRASDLSTGIHYRNQLIVFVPMDPVAVDQDGRKTVTITYDADGADNEYKASDLVVSYNGASFIAYTEFQLRVQNTTAAPPVGNSPAAGIRSSKMTSPNSAEIVFGGNGIKETENTAGVKGNWAGPVLIGPKDATKATYTVNVGGRTASYTAVLGSTKINNFTYPCFAHYENLASVKNATLKVSWKDSSNRLLGQEETFVLDFTKVSLDGEPPIPEEPDVPPVEITGVCDNIVLRSMYDDEISKVDNKLTLDSFGSAVNATGIGEAGYLGGTYRQVTPVGKDVGYYAPLHLEILSPQVPFSVTIDGKQVAAFSANDIKDAESDDLVAMVSVDALVPLKSLGSNISSFNIEIKATDGSGRKGVKMLVDTQQAAVDGVGMSVSEFSGDTEAIFGAPDLCNGVYFERVGTVVNINGVVNCREVGLDSKSTGWFVPVTLTSIKPMEMVVAGDAKKAVVTASVTDNPKATFTKEYTANAEGVVNVLLPMAFYTNVETKTGYKFDRITVEFNGDVLSFTLSEYATLEGIGELVPDTSGSTEPTPPPTEPVDPTPPPTEPIELSATFEVITDSSADLFGKTLADLGTGFAIAAKSMDSEEDAHTWVLTGDAKWVTDYTNFNQAVAKEQAGCYFPLVIKAEAGTKVTMLNLSDGAKNGKELTVGPDGTLATILWLSGQPADYAGTQAASLKAKTLTLTVAGDDTPYTLDFSQLQMASST